MRVNMLKSIGLLVIGSTILQSCGLYDLRTKMIKKEGITIESTNKGKTILERAWKAQGFDKLKNHRTYAYHGSDTWRGMLGRISLIWPEMKTEMDFKFQVGTFEGQTTFLDGKRKGDLAGLQNWNYYEISENDTLFKDKDDKENRRIVFGIAAFQYFTEMLDRIKDAPIISYAGEQECRGQLYDLVFCTWETDKPHEEHDQYVAWINKKTGLMDFTQYTLRELYLNLPGLKMLGAGVEFTDLRNIDGVLIPHQQLFYLMDIRKKQKNNFHELILSDFKFDSFKPEELRIDKSIKNGGNFKN